MRLVFDSDVYSPLFEVVKKYEWMGDALCAQFPDSFIFDGRGNWARQGLVRQAQNICYDCPVLAQCKSWSTKVHAGPVRWKGVVVAGVYYR
jgi:hypothetical protein